MEIFPVSDLGSGCGKRTRRGVVDMQKWSHFFDLASGKQFYKAGFKRHFFAFTEFPSELQVSSLS